MPGIAAVNATGWSNLTAMDLPGAVYAVWSTSTFGWGVFLLFITYQIALWLKTGSVTLGWTTGMIFMAIYLFGSTFGYVPTIYWGFVVTMCIFLMAAMLYEIFWK